MAHDHASFRSFTLPRVIWLSGLYPQPSRVRRQFSQSPGGGAASIASETGVSCGAGDNVSTAGRAAEGGCDAGGCGEEGGGAVAPAGTAVVPSASRYSATAATSASLMSLVENDIICPPPSRTMPRTSRLDRVEGTSDGPTPPLASVPWQVAHTRA